MDITAASVLRAHYSGFDLTFTREDSIPANKLSVIAQIGTISKGSLDIKSCVVSTMDQNPTHEEMKLSDFIKDHKFDAVIKNNDGMLMLHATLPAVGNLARFATCSYNKSADLELATSKESTIELKEGEEEVDATEYNSTNSNRTHFENPYISSPDGSVFHAKVHNIMEGRKFVGVNYFPFVLPGDVSATASALVKDTRSCDLTLTKLKDQERTVSKTTIQADISGSTLDGLHVSWNYDLPSDSEGHIVDIDIHCPELKVQSYAQYASFKSSFKIVDMTPRAALQSDDGDAIFEAVAFSGAVTSSLFVAAGLMVSALALLF